MQKKENKSAIFNSQIKTDDCCSSPRSDSHKMAVAEAAVVWQSSFFSSSSSGTGMAFLWQHQEHYYTDDRHFGERIFIPFLHGDKIPIYTFINEIQGNTTERNGFHIY